MEYLIVKWLHVLSSTVLFGTGIGSAYYMLFTSRTRDVHAIAQVARLVVVADWVFTATSVVLQPLTGFYLIHLMGYPLSSAWILWSIVLYLVAGAAWLPVVWMQIQMRDMAQAADAARQPLPARYWTFLRGWIGLGVIAFTALIVVFYLMVAKPV